MLFLFMRSSLSLRRSQSYLLMMTRMKKQENMINEVSPFDVGTCHLRTLQGRTSYPRIFLSLSSSSSSCPSTARARLELGSVEEHFNRAGSRPTEVPFTQVRPDSGSADAPFA